MKAFVSGGAGFIGSHLVKRLLKSERAERVVVYDNLTSGQRSYLQALTSDRRLCVRYDKKQHTPEMHHIDYGLGILRAESLAPWPDNEPFDLADVYRHLLSEKQLSGHEVTERFYEIGSPEGLAELDAFLRHQPAFIGL
jgi:NDP-sugar pyrophosphorylase family protein